MTTGYRPEIVQSAFINFISARLSPFWSLTTPRLRLQARYVLSDELITLQFEANQAFSRQVFASPTGWQGGQHIGLNVAIKGIYYQRYYSLIGLSKQPNALQQAITDDALLGRSQSRHASPNQKSATITIAIKPQGLVSYYLTEQVALGAIFACDMPAGDFTLQQSQIDRAQKIDRDTLSSSSPLLFIAGGSGITPMLGLITEALSQNRQVSLLYYHRGGSQNKITSQTQTPFLAYWQHLAASYATFNYHIVNTNDTSSYLAGSRYLTAESLLALALPLSETMIFACGSESLLSGLYQSIDEIDKRHQQLPADESPSKSSFSTKCGSLSNQPSLKNNLIIEHFGSALASSKTDIVNNSADKDADKNENAVQNDSVAPQMIYLRGRQQQFISDRPLLIAAEQAGIRLPYGCRQGICQLCRCQKISGIVKNIQTGKLSSNGYESIQTCNTVAMSEVVLAV